MQADQGSGETGTATLGVEGLDVVSNISSLSIKDNSRYVVSVSQVDPTTTAPEAAGLLNIQGTTIYISTGTDDPSDWKQIFPSL